MTPVLDWHKACIYSHGTPMYLGVFQIHPKDRQKNIEGTTHCTHKKRAVRMA